MTDSVLMKTTWESVSRNAVIDHLGSSVGEAVGINNNRLVFSNESHTAGLGHRKLLQSTGGNTNI